MRKGLLPAYIEGGYVIAVDAQAWRVTVRSTSGGHRVYENCLVGVPYLHPGGEGSGAMPEIGAAVWVCIPSEGDALPFIVAFRPLHGASEGSHRTNRAPRVPGDQFMLGREGNGIIAHRGGTTEVGATPIARRFYHPIGNRVHDIAEQYKLDTFGGSDEWVVAREEEDPDGHKATLRTTKFKAYSDDKAYVVEVEVGHVDDASAPVLRLRVYEDGDVDEESLSASLTLSLFQDGSVALGADGDVEVTLPSGKAFKVRTTEGNEEGVILGKTFLTDLQTWMNSMTTFFAALNSATTVANIVAAGTAMQAPHASFLAQVAVSVAGQAAPYLSTRTKTE